MTRSLTHYLDLWNIERVLHREEERDSGLDRDHGLRMVEESTHLREPIQVPEELDTKDLDHESHLTEPDIIAAERNLLHVPECDRDLVPTVDLRVPKDEDYAENSKEREHASMVTRVDSPMDNRCGTLPQVRHRIWTHRRMQRQDLQRRMRFVDSISKSLAAA